MARGRQFRRWLVLPAVLLYAALAWGSGLDRLAGERTVPEKWVPSLLRSGTHFADARRFVEAGIPASAAEPARQALLSEPVNPAAPALLGMALLGEGDPANADRAFRIAARLGWREPLTQLYWFHASMEQNDLGNAVLRFDAIARQHPDAPYVVAMGRNLEQSEAGRAAMARRIAIGANWVRSYATLHDGTSAQQIAARVDVLKRVGTLGRQIGCEDMVQPARVLASVDPAAGAQLWRQHCPRAARQPSVIDGGFDQPAFTTPELQVPFEWAITSQGGLDAGLVPASAGYALQARSTASVTLPFIEQLVPLSPGRYRLSWEMPDSDTLQRGRLLASLSCERDLFGSRAEAGRPDGNRLSREIIIPPECKSPWLRLWLAPGNAGAIVDNVRIDRL